MTDLYPFILEPLVKEAVWGGRWLHTVLGRPGEDKTNLAESWEAYSESVVVNGKWAGKKLGELFQEYGQTLFGEYALGYPKFPLLVKFIDAHQNLSVQVHPDDVLAWQLEDYPFGKTEFWYIISAEPGAEIYYGLNAKAENPEQLETAIQNKNLPDFLQKVPVKAGDVIFIPAGTVHALTGGIVVYELQQDSDITYRLYDWGRTGRQLHIEKGLKAINFSYKEMQVRNPEIIEKSGIDSAELVSCDLFTSSFIRISSRIDLGAAPGSFTLVSVINGNGSLDRAEGGFPPIDLKKGNTILIPTGLNFSLSSTNLEIPLEVISSSLTGKL